MNLEFRTVDAAMYVKDTQHSPFRMVSGLDSGIVLASASPRRLQLLEEVGWRVKVDPAGIEEKVGGDENIEDAALRLASAKAEAVAERNSGCLVLGADTMVFCAGRILGKPGSVDEARDMLRFLSGRGHTVITGVALLHPGEKGAGWIKKDWVSRTQVFFHSLSESMIDQYLSRVHTLDKAGSYAIQEYGDCLVARIEGSRSNVLGLPIEEVNRAFSDLRQIARA